MPSSDASPRPRRIPRLALVFGIPSALIMILFVTGIVRVYDNPTRSMAPTIQPGDTVLVTRDFGDDWQRGDLVVFIPPTAPDSRFIQRIAALPGDRVEILDGHLAVNGRHPLSPEGNKAEPPEDPHPQPVAGNAFSMIPPPSFPLTVPKDHVFLLGDNYPNSLDSRYVGCVPVDDLVQRPQAVIWPPGRAGGLD